MMFKGGEVMQQSNTLGFQFAKIRADIQHAEKAKMVAERAGYHRAALASLNTLETRVKKLESELAALRVKR